MMEQKSAPPHKITVPLTGLSALAFVLLAGPTLAAAPGVGFTGPGPDIMTVEQVKSLSDDAQIALSGNIIRSLGGKKYLFQDATGTITLEIKANRWEGQQVGPESRVEIHGELDKDWTSIEVEVDRIIVR